MSIQRVPQVPFAQIANEALRDRRLSFKARGLLACVLSHSGEWTAGLSWLERQSDVDGRASIQSALNELTALGYRVVHREQVDGQIRTVVVWKHAPDDAISRPTENLTVRFPDRQESGASIEHHPSEHHSLEDQKSVRFDEFWSVYPRKAAKDAAARAWQKAVRREAAEVILAGARRYADDPNRDPAFTAHAATWLNQGRWADEPLPGRSTRGTSGQARMDAYSALLDDLMMKEIEG